MAHKDHKANPVRKVRQEKMVKTELKGPRVLKVNLGHRVPQDKTELKGYRAHKVNLGHRVPQDKMEPKAHKAQLVKTEFRAHKAPKAQKVRKEKLDRLVLMAMMASRPMPMLRKVVLQGRRKNLRKSWQRNI